MFILSARTNSMSSAAPEPLNTITNCLLFWTLSYTNVNVSSSPPTTKHTIGSNSLLT